MKKILVLLFLIYACSSVCYAQNDSIQALLIGDSTTKGFLPATVHPERMQLKDMLQTWYNCHSRNTSIKVFNSSKGGETAKSLMQRYDSDIIPYKKQHIDLIIVRYGINDWYKCKDIDTDYPNDLKNLFMRLQKDFPKAKIIAQTITPFLKETESIRMNNHIKAVAGLMKIPVNDIYTPFKKEMDENGETDYWVRMVDVDEIPTKYREWLKPYIYKTGGGKNQKETLLVDDNSLDPFFKDLGILKHWVNHHPNSAGYAIITRETANYLLKFMDK